MAKVLDMAGLRTQLADPNPKVRSKAAKAARSTGDQSAVPLLDGALRIEQDPKVAEVMITAIVRLGGPDAVGPMAFGLTHCELGKVWRMALASKLGEFPDDDAAIEALIAALDGEGATARQQAALSLAASSSPRAAEGVGAAFRSGAIHPAKGAGGKLINSVAVARTLDLFFDDPAVHRAFSDRTRSGDTVMAALRLGGFPRVEGGVVAFQDRLVLAIRQARLIKTSDEVTRLIESPFTQIEEFGRIGLGFGVRTATESFVIGHEDDFDIANKAQRWLWDQWAPHITRIQELIATARA